MRKKVSLPPGLEELMIGTKRKRFYGAWSLFLITGIFASMIFGLLWFRFPIRSFKDSIKPPQQANVVDLLPDQFSHTTSLGYLQVLKKTNNQTTAHGSSTSMTVVKRNIQKVNIPSETFSEPKGTVEQQELFNENTTVSFYHLWQAKTFEEKGLLEEALREYQAICSQNKEMDPIIVNKVAYLYISLGKFSEAKRILEEAIATAPPYPGIYVNYGVILAKLGDLQEAERVFRNALKLFPDEKDLLYNLAVLLELKGDINGAKEIYEKLHLLGDPEATNALQRLNITS